MFFTTKMVMRVTRMIGGDLGNLEHHQISHRFYSPFWTILRHYYMIWVQDSFWIFFWLRFCFFWLPFLVPFALYLQQLGTRICHFAYLLHVGMVPWHFAWYLLHLGMVTLHGYLLHFWPCSPSILHGICHVLALQPLIRMVFAKFWYFKHSFGFLENFLRRLFRVSVGFHLGFHLKFHLGFI